MTSLKFLNNDNYQTYNRDVARECGNINAAILLSDLINRFEYHSYRKELIYVDGQYWFYYTHQRGEERLVMSRRQQDTAVKILESIGWVECRTMGQNNSRHFRIIEENILEFFGLQPLSKCKTGMAKSAKPVCTKAPNRPGVKRQTLHIDKNSKKKEFVGEDPERVSADRKIRFNGPKGEVIIDESDFFRRIIMEEKDLNYTTEEIQYGVKVLKEYTGIVHDWKKFLNGTIEKKRKAEKQKFATGEKTPRSKKSQHKGEGICKNTIQEEQKNSKKSTLDQGTKEQASEPLVCLGDLLKISSSGQKPPKES